MRVLTFLLLVLAGVCFALPAAAGTIEDQLSAYSDHTVEGYLRPLSEALGQNLNSGFFTTAAIPQDGFHLRLELQGGMAFFGDDDKTFQATAGDDFPNQDPTAASTIIGGTSSTSLSGGNGTSFLFPGGLDMSSASMLAPQVTVGSFYGTEGTFRWLGIDTGDSELGKLDVLGFGIRHSVSQWFEDWPVDVAASVFYQTFEAGDNKLFDASGLSIGGQVSKRFDVLEPFGSLTYDTWDMKSQYTENEGEPEEELHVIEFEKDSTVHFMAGLGLNFGFLKIYGAANFAQRFGVTGGIGIGN